MEIYLFGSGDLVDELVVTAGDLELRRGGSARYLARFKEGGLSAEVEFWTTKKGRVRADAWPDCPSWLRLETMDDGTLDSIDAVGVDVHVEHIDRGVYFFGFSRGRDRWALSLASDGYIKFRIRGGTVAPRLRARSSQL